MTAAIRSGRDRLISYTFRAVPDPFHAFAQTRKERVTR